MADNYSTADIRGIGPMGKVMSIAGMVIGGVLAIAFALDLVVHAPFGGKSPLMDIGFLVCSGILAYLSWSVFRESP
jgi:hypothetical protein